MLGNNKKLPLWRRLRRRGYWLLLVILIKSANRLPVAWGRQWGKGLARLALKIRPRERQRAFTNIQLAYPEWDKEAVNGLLTKSVDALGVNFFDILVCRRLVAEDCWIRDEADALSDGESLVDVLVRLKKKGRGVIILSGHLGCWELSGGGLVNLWKKHFSEPLDLSVITGTIHNPAVNSLLQNQRKKMGVEILPREAGMKPLLRKLNNGGVVAILLDQKTSVRNLPIPFFGRLAPTPVNIAAIALKREIPILPVVMAREGQGHILRHLSPLDPKRYLGPEGEAGEKQQKDLLEACNLQLEQLIRRNPTEWVWFHDRWDTAILESDPGKDSSH